MTSDLEALLRDTALTHGHIQLFKNQGDGGWEADVHHYQSPRAATGGKTFSDPVDALRAVLIEDERMGRQLQQRYASARKLGAVVEPPPVDADGFCMICEAGGCDACRPAPEADDFEELLR